MRRSSSLAAPAVLVVLLTLLLAGCRLTSDSKNCAGEPGEAGGGVSVCTKPPPNQFNQMGQ
jgi:hypothetical protein